MWTSRSHDCKDDCICTTQNPSGAFRRFVRNPECPAVGHSADVNQVEFSDDGAQVISGSVKDNTVRDSPRKQCQGCMFGASVGNAIAVEVN